MSEKNAGYGNYREPLTPGELLEMALKEFEGVTEENFRERIKAGVEYVLAAKNWVDGNLMFQEKCLLAKEERPVCGLIDQQQKNLDESEAAGVKALSEAARKSREKKRLR